MTEKSTTEKELEILFPLRIFHTKQGQVEVKPFKFKHFIFVLEIARGYAELFDGSVDFIKFLLDHGEKGLKDLATLTEFSTGKDRAFLDELSGDEAIDLFFKVFEVNADFFVQKITSGAATVARRIKASSNLGESKSPDLLEAGIDGTISKTTAKPN